MTNWRKFLNDIIGGFSGDGGAAQDDSIKASLDLAHTDLDAIITDTAAPEIIANIFDINMGYWTEVDLPGRVTINYALERIEISNLDGDEDVYVYKATAADVADFILDFEFQILDTASFGSAFGIGLADGLGTMEDVNNGLYVWLQGKAGDTNDILVRHMTNGTEHDSGGISIIADNTTYYGRLIRRGSYCLLGIYTDSIRETHVTGSPLEYKDTAPIAFTHLYPMAAYDDGGTGEEMDAYVEAVKLISAPDIDKYLRPGEGGTNTVLSGIDTKVTKPEIIANIFDIDMGYWTEVDVPGRVTIDYTNERIAIADLDLDEDVYVYKATSANVNDFILDFEYKVLNTTSVIYSSLGIGLADGAGTMEDVDNGLYAKVTWEGVNDHALTIMHTTGGTVVQSDKIDALADDTTYYGRLIRRGSYCWLAIYSDRIRETHVGGSPIEYKDTTPVAFTHLYPMVGYDSGDVGRDMDAYIERIKLISAPDIDKYLGRYVE